MPNKAYPVDITTQAQTVLDQWKQIDPNMNIGELNQAALLANLEKTLPIQSRLTVLETEMTNLRNQRDEICGELWDQVKRIRNGIKAIYGDDSSQYEMIGGTRRSERKRPSRKSTTAKTE